MPRDLKPNEKWTSEKCPKCGGRVLSLFGVAIQCENVVWAIERGEPVEGHGRSKESPCDYVLASG